jgi:hypothetical protein
MMKVGIAIGGMTWGSDNRTAARTYGGSFRNNVFKTSGSGYFGCASEGPVLAVSTSRS